MAMLLTANTSVIRQLHAATTRGYDTTTQRNWPVASTAFTTVLAALQSWPLAAAGPVNAANPAIVLTRSSAPWLDAVQL